jgi:hypothetical protein
MLFSSEDAATNLAEETVPVELTLIVISTTSSGNLKPHRFVKEAGMLTLPASSSNAVNWAIDKFSSEIEGTSAAFFAISA